MANHKKKTSAKKMSKSTMKRTKGGTLNFSAVAFHFDKKDFNISSILQHGSGGGEG